MNSLTQEQSKFFYSYCKPALYETELLEISNPLIIYIDGKIDQIQNIINFTNRTTAAQLLQDNAWNVDRATGGYFDNMDKYQNIDATAQANAAPPDQCVAP